MAHSVTPLQWVAVKLIRLYQLIISPLLGPRCRFTPTCSEYAQLAIYRHGWLAGSVRAMARIARCTPLHPGGVDLP